MGEEISDQALTLARIEVKIDTLISASSDHETRLRSLEQKPDVRSHGFVTGKQLWSVAVGFSTVLYSVTAAVMLLNK